MSRKLDLGHVFDRLGRSVLSQQHLEDEHKRLADENERLRIALGKMRERLKFYDVEHRDILKDQKLENLERDDQED